MSRIARSATPLFVMVGEPYSFAFRLTAPGTGAPISLVGATIEARLKVRNTFTPIQVVATEPSDGRFRVSGGANVEGPLVPGSGGEIIVTITDTQGGIRHYVWPLIGEFL